ncbi:UNVERIFIED_CONTAM: hypothetical protein Slati_3503000 [Sesamum latifolium]|uniref:Reverse transcriptase/retrotransposon-derived protein RNase H-like domain-containing protein n=1 Tax=Sesamum latifolium TaxID=2727402 RepID=A0AAW2UMY0_9LAMI
MRPPANLNKVRKLVGCLEILNRFISCSVERSLPFFIALRKTKNFAWDEARQQAFQDLKAYLADLPLFTKPSPSESLYLYLAMGQQAVSSVLIEKEERNRKPVYYVSNVLHGFESGIPR